MDLPCTEDCTHVGPSPCEGLTFAGVLEIVVNVPILQMGCESPE